jgi:hypothetical protein
VSFKKIIYHRKNAMKLRRCPKLVVNTVRVPYLNMDMVNKHKEARWRNESTPCFNPAVLDSHPALP